MISSGDAFLLHRRGLMRWHESGYDVEFRKSWLYEYRFHALLTPKQFQLAGTVSFNCGRLNKCRSIASVLEEER
jgi:hypothetical protein